MANINNKNTIQGTLNWCAAFILNRPTKDVAGFFQEPGLTLANLVMSSILAPPFAWPWNRVEIPFVTTPGNTDYLVIAPNFGWLEKATRFNANDNPTTVELQLSPSLSASGAQDTPFQISLFRDDNNGNLTFRLLSVPDDVYTITLTYQLAPIFATSLFGPSLGSISSIAAAVTGFTTYTGTFPNGALSALAGQYLYVRDTTSTGGTTFLNNGLYFCTASTATTITLQNPKGVVQAGAGGIIQTATTWAPIPDKYNFLYERGMLAHLHGIYDAATYAMELQLFFRQLVGCSEGLSDTAKAIFLEDKLRQIATEAAAMAATSASPKRAQ